MKTLKDFSWGQRTLVMGILNVTPDSFTGDGMAAGNRPGSRAVIAASLAQARRFVEAGVDILDVGGESTRPGAVPVSVQDELDRVIPVIEALRREVDVVVSVDTYKGAVVEAALAAGSEMVNDVWGLRADPLVGTAAARYDAWLVLNHNRSSWAPEAIRSAPAGRMAGEPYVDLLGDVKRELLESAALAGAAGVPANRIVLDPGLGFGKAVSENLALLRHLDVIKALGYPVLIGPSRKGFIGKLLDRPPDQRLEGTAAAVTAGISRGADIVRVHDVAFMVPLVRMADAIFRA